VLKSAVSSSEEGNAPLETIFAMVMLMLLVVGVIEVAFFLYGRNVVAASAHEGARAAIELGRDRADAVEVATHTVRSATGDLLEDLDVLVSTTELDERTVVVVEVRGRLRGFGPVPVSAPVGARATASMEEPLR
jgi:Flp pilus assembly protein TadG